MTLLITAEKGALKTFFRRKRGRRVFPAVAVELLVDSTLLRLLELPDELLEKTVTLLRPCEWGSFARASKATKAIADGVHGDMVNAEVSRLLDAHQLVGDRLCAQRPALEVLPGLTIISDSAFRGCTSLTTLKLPVSVTTIGEHAVARCTSLTSVTLPTNLTTVSDRAFASCTSLVSLTLPDGVTTIGWSAFAHCYSLTSLTLPDGLTTIGWYTFRDCSSLTSLKLPTSVTTIGSAAFCGCTCLDADSRAAIAAINPNAL